MPHRVPVGRFTLPFCTAVGHLVDADAPGRELLRVELDPHRVLLRAVHLHLRHAVDGREPLRQERLGVLVELRQRQRAWSGARSTGSARTTGPPSGSSAAACPAGAGAAAWEIAACTSWAAASMLRLSANCRVIWVLPWLLVEVIVVDAGDGRELLLQRRRHRGGHRLGARARAGWR